MTKQIYKWSLAYAIARAYVRQGFRFFYSCIHINGVSRIPQDRPVILAPNHQNALMDALAAMHGLQGVHVFMARADIFKNKKIARLLHFLKIMPVFRMRDGYENLGKNDVIFNQAVEVLCESRFLCIMPEGTHSEYRHLKPLVKGMFRLAFKFIEENPDKPAPVIVPVGLDYSSYSAYRGNLVIQYGTPIDSLEFYEEYKKNPPVAINLIRERLSEELKKHMIHIEKLEHYHSINFTRGLFLDNNSVSGCYNRFLADKKFTEYCNSLPDAVLSRIEPLAKKIEALVKKHGISTQNFHESAGPMKLLILAGFLAATFPVFATGYLYHILPLRAPIIITKKVEDQQFHGSIKFVLSIFTFPLWYLITGIIFAFMLDSALFALGFLFVLYLSGEFAYNYYRIFQKFRYCYKKLKFKNEFDEAYQDFQKIKKLLNIK